jgi:hypothetical protein
MPSTSGLDKTLEPVGAPAFDQGEHSVRDCWNSGYHLGWQNDKKYNNAEPPTPECCLKIANNVTATAKRIPLIANAPSNLVDSRNENYSRFSWFLTKWLRNLKDFPGVDGRTLAAGRSRF